jgi:hypothetical protein
MMVKRSYHIFPAEATTMRAVARHTKINVPRVHRFFTEYDDEGGGGPYNSIGYLVLDYVDGIPLARCWKNLPDTQCGDIATQVAGKIGELQKLHFSKPGPLRRGPSRGPWFCDHGAGPFSDAADFNAFFNRKLDHLKRKQRAPPTLPAYEFQEEFVPHTRTYRQTT